VIIVPHRSPQRSAHEERVLVKPHDWTRAAVTHRVASDGGRPEIEQPWEPRDAEVLVEVATEAAETFGVRVVSAGPDDAHLRLGVDFGEAAPDDAITRAIALCCSAARPRLWLLVGRYAIRGGVVWRRQRGVTPNWREARDVHLPRDVRAKVRYLLNRPRVGGNRETAKERRAAKEG